MEKMSMANRVTNKNKKKYCDNCKMTGHTCDKSFTLIIKTKIANFGGKDKNQAQDPDISFVICLSVVNY
jgi:hypothetical protein